MGGFDFDRRYGLISGRRVNHYLESREGASQGLAFTIQRLRRSYAAMNGYTLIPSHSETNGLAVAEQANTQTRATPSCTSRSSELLG